MPNVRLRTIINVDNSTTFQVQREDGEWVDLTWEMITDKPFSTLDDTIFTVDENGVLSIISLSTPDWQNIVNKPFITLDPSDFTVDNNGVLKYSGSMDWASLTGKPFSSLDNNDFIVNNGKLSVIHQNIPNQGWSQITGKPFTSLNDQQFQVIGGTLYLNVATNPQWSNVQNKPFSSINPNNFTVENGMLNVIPPTIPDPEWNDVQNKPLSSLNSDDFTVDENGEASVNFPTPTPDSWQDVTSKPFETLNETDFSVDPDTGELSLAGGGSVDWSSIQNKPFNYIGTGLYVYDGKLMNRYFTYIRKSMPAKHIAYLTTLKMFIQNMLRSALANRLGVTASIVTDYYPLLLEGASNYMYLYLRIDNTQTDLTQFSDGYEVMVEAECYRNQEGSSEDKFMIAYRVNGMPLLDASNVAKRYMIEGLAQYRAAKTDGEYTSVSYDSTSMASCSECNSFNISSGTII